MCFFAFSSLQLTNFRTWYVELSVKEGDNSMRTAVSPLEEVACYPWHTIYFRRFSRLFFKTRNRLEGFGDFFFFSCFSSVSNELQYSFCHSGNEEPERKLWGLKAILRGRRVKRNKFIYHHSIKGKMHSRKEKKVLRDLEESKQLSSLTEKQHMHIVY